MANPLAWRLDERAREVALDPAAFEAGAERLTDAIRASRSQPRELLQRLGEASAVLRIAGRLEEAQNAASAAVALADLLGDARAAFENQLHLARVMHWQGRFALSTPLFDLLVAQARSMAQFGDLLDAALHHAGLNLLDEGKAEQAAHHLREALAIRARSGDAALVEATTRALAAAARGVAAPFVEKRS